MIEIRPHPTLDGILVRNDGMIFIPENKSTKAHWTYGTLEPNGYYRVHLRHKHFRVHRLVAETFIPNPENKPLIDHIDRNPSNNNVYNLRWVTHQENMNNMKTNRKIGERRCDLSKSEYSALRYKEWRTKPENRKRLNSRKNEWQKQHRAQRNAYVKIWRKKHKKTKE